LMAGRVRRDRICRVSPAARDRFEFPHDVGKRLPAPIRTRMPPCSGQSRPRPSGGREDAASLDRPCTRRLRDLAVGTEECSQRGSNQRMAPKRMLTHIGLFASRRVCPGYCSASCSPSAPASAYVILPMKLLDALNRACPHFRGPRRRNGTNRMRWMSGGVSRFRFPTTL
jgi:hypothetical protein